VGVVGRLAALAKGQTRVMAQPMTAASRWLAAVMALRLAMLLGHLAALVREQARVVAEAMTTASRWLAAVMAVRLAVLLVELTETRRDTAVVGAAGRWAAFDLAARAARAGTVELHPRPALLRQTGTRRRPEATDSETVGTALGTAVHSTKDVNVSTRQTLALTDQR